MTYSCITPWSFCAAILGTFILSLPWDIPQQLTLWVSNLWVIMCQVLKKGCRMEFQITNTLGMKGIWSLFYSFEILSSDKASNLFKTTQLLRASTNIKLYSYRMLELEILIIFSTPPSVNPDRRAASDRELNIVIISSFPSYLSGTDIFICLLLSGSLILSGVGMYLTK